MVRKKFVTAISVLAIVYSSLIGCVSNDSQDIVSLANLEEQNEKVTQLESETEKLIMDINIADYYKTDIETVDNHYYIDENNVLWGSGWNQDGQLGQGTVDDKVYEEPVKIAENVIHIDATQYNVLIYITSDNKLYGLGEASYGNFSDVYQRNPNNLMWEQNVAVSEPKLLMEDVVYAVCGRYDLAILKENSEVWIQGVIWARYANQYHYLSEPTKVLEDAALITGGFYNHAALLEDGTVWTWGHNYAGNCGVQNKDMVSEPEKVAEDVVMVWTKEFESIGKEFEYFQDATVIKKSDGTYWITGSGIGEEKNLSMYYEVQNIKMECSFEFILYDK